MWGLFFFEGLVDVAAWVEEDEGVGEEETGHDEVEDAEGDVGPAEGFLALEEDGGLAEGEGDVVFHFVKAGVLVILMCMLD